MTCRLSFHRSEGQANIYPPDVKGLLISEIPCDRCLRAGRLTSVSFDIDGTVQRLGYEYNSRREEC